MSGDVPKIPAFADTGYHNLEDVAPVFFARVEIMLRQIAEAQGIELRYEEPEKERRDDE